ncbi:unnamed protein product, partial [Schistocephalus solidus]|uniref:DUF3504 domain-containing protein n=1 Tax=Schistocephalus solidus TaxID=70667 RepID=A0A183S7M8_SCHSO
MEDEMSTVNELMEILYCKEDCQCLVLELTVVLSYLYFQRRYQQSEGVAKDFQQTLRLLCRRAFSTMDLKALNPRVLEQLFAGVHNPQIRKALLPVRPSTLEKVLSLACEGEVLQATCEQPPRSPFGATTVQPNSFHNAATQTPWKPCSCGSYPRRNNWRRPNSPQARSTIHAIDANTAPSDGQYYLVHDTVITCFGSRNPEGQVTRWQEKLAKYEFKCVFQPDRQHRNADALSRKPHRPHGECPSCTDVNISTVALQSDQCLLWAAAQRRSAYIPINNRKASNARPLRKSELAGYSYETRCLHRLWDKLLIENGVLCYHDSEQYPKRVMLPLSMVEDVVEWMHAELGHSGIHKTEQLHSDLIQTYRIVRGRDCALEFAD